ncbi:GlxA family transcriptional regulator [Paraburkholderia phenoliruptrix]|uniref:AraC family transcriptional regulator n=2 Tax=Paraburkholderia phenoliruptrix TaxID=252970 RepID=K0DT88_9BURK|nr:AraC family transcriptional regulator [Paraburkholderia phenoliruptrix]AFT87822.1 AraC family transcriptional regulator [Paraburkholderia phenoliruptrix BR3459a]CAB4046727.1 HTH-type transcriptional activator RhaS [Paraburkholderia phenoliruptrix]
MDLVELSRPIVNEKRDCPETSRHIGLLVSQNFFTASAGAIGDAFRLANRAELHRSEDMPYRLTVLSEEGGLVTSSCGISIVTEQLNRYSVSDFHAFFVACRDATATAEPNDRLHSWITRHGAVASLRITQGSRLAVVYKNASRLAVPVFLFDDNPVTSRLSGTTPAELALSQIERDLGPLIARKVALELQTTAAKHTRPREGDAKSLTTATKVRESARWIQENYSKPISVAQAAESAAMSKRNFRRRFKQEFGMTPLEYLLRTRFDVVCTMLSSTNIPVGKIARRCGMGDGNRLGRLFKERYGMSPTEFRAQRHVSL